MYILYILPIEASFWGEIMDSTTDTGIFADNVISFSRGRDRRITTGSRTGYGKRRITSQQQPKPAAATLYRPGDRITFRWGSEQLTGTIVQTIYNVDESTPARSLGIYAYSVTVNGIRHHVKSASVSGLAVSA
jgi:hypothetical protein